MVTRSDVEIAGNLLIDLLNVLLKYQSFALLRKVMGDNFKLPVQVFGLF